MHTHLFVLGSRPESLFGDGLDPNAPKILCREGGANEPSKKPPYRWWEFQATQAMAALLLPTALID